MDFCGLPLQQLRSRARWLTQRVGDRGDAAQRNRQHRLENLHLVHSLYGTKYPFCVLLPPRGELVQVGNLWHG